VVSRCRAAQAPRTPGQRSPQRAHPSALSPGRRLTACRPSKARMMFALFVGARTTRQRARCAAARRGTRGVSARRAGGPAAARRRRGGRDAVAAGDGRAQAPDRLPRAPGQQPHRRGAPGPGAARSLGRPLARGQQKRPMGDRSGPWATDADRSLASRVLRLRLDLCHACDYRSRQSACQGLRPSAFTQQLRADCRLLWCLQARASREAAGPAALQARARAREPKHAACL